MKSVLISIQPKWCELIASGKKTVEVRKSRPKIATPFKVYGYATWNGSSREILVKDGGTLFVADYRTPADRASGKVIGEFVCDRIDDMRDVEQKPTCLTVDEWLKYTDGHKGIVYGWHISRLVIYDKPKELREFFYACDKPKGSDCSVCLDHRENRSKAITRPPQSWCYVEEVGDEQH